MWQMVWIKLLPVLLRWAEGEEAGAGRVMGRARADSGSGSDSEGEDEAAKQERRTRMNMELKRHMTSILLEVTDPLFSAAPQPASPARACCLLNKRMPRCKWGTAV